MIPAATPVDAARDTPGEVEQRREQRPWAVPAVAIAVFLVTALIYWPSTQSLLIEWFETPSSSYTHGVLVVGIVLWLLLRASRDAGVANSPAWELTACAVVAMGLSLVWLIAWRAGIQVAHQALLPVLILANLALVLGRRIARSSLMPLAILYSAIPVWHLLLPPLQALTVKVVGAMLRIAGVPAYVEGDFVYIRSGVFHVEDGCSGLHYFIVGVTIALLSGELRHDRWRTRAALLAVAVALALLSNWVRVFIIIVAGYLTDMQHFLVRVDHGTFGWVVFAVAMLVYVFIVRRWRYPDAPVASTPVRGDSGWRRFGVGAALAAMATGIVPLWIWVAPIGAADRPNLAIPAGIDGWSGPTSRCAMHWKPRYESADWQQQREYRRDGQAVCLYMATYLSQHQGKELINYFQSIHEPDSDVVAARVREVSGLALNELQLGSRTGADRLIWYAYAIGDTSMRRGIEAQLAYAMGTLWGPRASSVYAVSAECAPDCAAARESLQAFLPHVVATFRAGESP